MILADFYVLKQLGSGSHVTSGMNRGVVLELNLASGVNESFGNENCLWINGVLFPLTDVLFEKVNDELCKLVL